MYMTASLFLERLSTSKSIPRKKIFLFGGSDIFSKEICAQALVSQFFKKCRVVSGNGKEMGKLDGQMMRLSMFEGAESALIRMHNIGSGDITPALKEWSNKNYLAFVDSGDELTSGKPIYDYVKENGLVVNCEPYPEYSDDMKAMVGGMFKPFNKVPDESVIRAITLRSGNDVMVASNLVKILCLSGAPLTEQGVASVSDYDRRDDAFELVVSIAMKRVEKVFLILRTLMDRQESPRLILDRMAHIYSSLWCVLKMPKGERVPWQIQGVLSVASHESRQLAYIQKMYTEDSVSRIYKLILGAYDWALNKGYNPSLALSILMIDIIENS